MSISENGKVGKILYKFHFFLFPVCKSTEDMGKLAAQVRFIFAKR